jgi:hypothetical protein
MRIHITQTTKQFLAEKTFELKDRGVLEVSDKTSLKTFIVVGKYVKTGNLEMFPYTEIEDIAGIKKAQKYNPKWEGFTLL